MSNRKEYQRGWRIKNKDKVSKSNKKWREKNKIRVSEYKKEYSLKFPEKIKGWSKNFRRKLKQQIINAYGGECECCGENTFEFLSIDHPEKNGKEHRKITGWGVSLYQWIVKNDYPDTLRLLCMNCNCSYGFYGYCPHSKQVTP